MARRRSTGIVSRRRATGSPPRASACSGLRGVPRPGVPAGNLTAADLPKTLVLLGLVGLMDPPREAIEAVRECHGGGIRVTITGDHKITTAAIAKMLDIATAGRRLLERKSRK